MSLYAPHRQLLNRLINYTAGNITTFKSKTTYLEVGTQLLVQLFIQRFSDFSHYSAQVCSVKVSQVHLLRVFSFFGYPLCKAIIMSSKRGGDLGLPSRRKISNIGHTKKSKIPGPSGIESRFSSAGGPSARKFSTGAGGGGASRRSSVQTNSRRSV